jgi:hypothetical protein
VKFRFVCDFLLDGFFGVENFDFFEVEKFKNWSIFKLKN